MKQRIADLLGTNDDRMIELAVRTSNWAGDILIFPGEAIEKLAVVASAYAVTCAPIFCTDRSNDVISRLLLIFLCIDDSSRDDISLGEPPSLGPYSAAFDQWLAEFHELESCPAADRERFFGCFYDYVRARKSEPVGQQLTVEEHWDSRKRTIFVRPFVLAQSIANAVHVNDLGTLADQCIEQVAYAAFLSNDLGSRSRDLEETNGDLNVIDTYRRVHSWSEAIAYEYAVGLYNDVIGRLHHHFRNMMATDASENVAKFINIIEAAVDGNVRAMHVLSFRYSNIKELDRLLARASSDHAGQWRTSLGRS